MLRDILDKEHYLNFLSLSCGVSILMNEMTATKHSEYASNLLKSFVKNSIKLFGRNFVTYNVHSLVHLPEAASRYGSLQNCSSYPFENHMRILKRCVHNAKNPLVQLVRRLHEYEQFTDFVHDKSAVSAVNLSAKPPDNCFLLSNGNYCLCHEILSGRQIVCEVFLHSTSWFRKPLCDSRLLGIHKVMLKAVKMSRVPVESICRKAIFVRICNKTAVIMPFLHSL